MTEIKSLQRILYCGNYCFNAEDSTVAQEKLPSFLSVTNRFDTNTLKGIVFDEEVLNGTVEEEIKNTQAESNLIQKIITKNIEGSIFDSENITVSENIPAQINEKTNPNKLLRNINYDDNYNKEIQQTIITKGIETLVNWLDDYINNYDERVAEGKDRGDSEVKLSFLLKLRKAIENCDFPIGFGASPSFEQQPEQNYIVLGSYSWTQYLNYLNPEGHTNNNAGILNHTNRSIILNAGIFCVDRKYTTETQLISAIERGVYDYLNEDDVTSEQIQKAKSEILMSSDEYYYNFASAYFASILAHELIHSTHIINEAVTYATCEMLEDDFRNQIISANWSAETQAAVDKIFSNLDLNSITYDEGYLPTYGGNLGFHSLGDSDDVANHGHEENLAYEDYTGWLTGKTLEDDKKELMNFIV